MMDGVRLNLVDSDPDAFAENVGALASKANELSQHIQAVFCFGVVFVDLYQISSSQPRTKNRHLCAKSSPKEGIPLLIKACN